jgi:hypothetical protein
VRNNGEGATLLRLFKWCGHQYGPGQSDFVTLKRVRIIRSQS